MTSPERKFIVFALLFFIASLVLEAAGTAGSKDVNAQMEPLVSNMQQVVAKPAEGELAVEEFVKEDSVPIIVQAKAPEKKPVKKSSVVAINRATCGEFEVLPGVGPKLAQAICIARKSRGRFEKPEDLLEIKGIGPKKLENMKPYLKFD
jgi:competence ComEA-like helix-hairpin-helix protein